MKQTISGRGGINGWHVLFGMIAFFLIVTAVDGVMIYKAVSTFGGDTPDAYRTGLLYNQRIAEERRQDERGWTESTKFDGRTGTFSVTLKDHAGHGVDGLQITGTIGRPATDIADHNLVLTAAGGGTYSTVVPNLSEGTWDISLVASQGDGAQRSIVYRAKARLWKQP
ncbi:FixH family protein [Hyphomicrobium sp. 99]|uniref:FixH family protein n=1 Tax=Hyphomicrobium sp. 99 TaxID=1163419 RepID=UPI0005F7FF80|nr:FixH family protein [Hyphomicrobium sp. 99]